MSIYHRLFDYAGVFPPAALPLDEAVEQYRDLRSGEDGWLVGPMLVRAGQVEAGSGVAALGVVADPPVPSGRYAQVEARCRPGEVAAVTGELLGFSAVVYLESATDDPAALIPEIARVRAEGKELRAKLRTGGLEAEAFPAVDTVAAFILRCVAAGIPFKATAGLHHPFLTPSDVEGATEHGFVNLLAATRAALAGADDLTGCLTEQDRAAFELATATWRGTGADLAPRAVRSSLAGIGSCSIDEPAGYLRDLGVGPVVA